MAMNSGIIGIVESEVIFVAIDGEVGYNGQPCGVIVAKTMALAHSAATKVDITYERMQIDRPIIPSLHHWREKYELSSCEDNTVYCFPANCESERPLVGQGKKIKGIHLKRIRNSSALVLL